MAAWRSNYYGFDFIDGTAKNNRPLFFSPSLPSDSIITAREDRRDDRGSIDSYLTRR